MIRDEEQDTEYYYCAATGVRQQERPGEEPTADAQAKDEVTRSQAMPPAPN